MSMLSQLLRNNLENIQYSMARGLGRGKKKYRGTEKPILSRREKRRFKFMNF
jgi:hypothetical protein